MTKFIDLSHIIEDGLVTYKGLPAPIICDYLSRAASKKIYDKDTTFQIGKIEMVANTGTYLDTPFHRYQKGNDLSQINLEQMANLPGVKVIIPDGVTKINETYFTNMDVKGKAVLVNTNWSRYWNTEQYYEGHPYLTESAANHLKQEGAQLVGIDSLNIDNVKGGTRPVHSILLGADILIVEHMCNLKLVPIEGFRFYAVPVKFNGVGTFPVRAFVEID